MSDLAVRLKTDGYRAVERDRRRRRVPDDVDTWTSRLLGRRAVVVRGQEGARLFYDESVVRRRDAVPPPLALLLFGPGAVHALDDEAHHERKEMFLGVLAPVRTPQVATTAGALLEEALAAAAGGRELDLHRTLVEVYGAAVLRWAGVELPPGRERRLSRELSRIVDGFGFAPLAYPRAWVARLRTDRWGRRLVEGVRAGEVDAAVGSPLAVLAASPLPSRVAAVELGNLLRPTVAVSWLGAFAALALDAAPEWRERLVGPGAAERIAFAQEVRRTTPFAPALAGRARRGAELDGVRLRERDLLVLDIVGINHHPRTFEHPHLFRPERFLGRHPGPYEIVPQGGGRPEGHRCPGEPLTVQLLAETLRVLAAWRYDLVSDRTVDLGRIPTLPEGGVRLRVR